MPKALESLANAMGTFICLDPGNKVFNRLGHVYMHGRPPSPPSMYDSSAQWGQNDLTGGGIRDITSLLYPLYSSRAYHPHMSLKGDLITFIGYTHLSHTLLI